MRFIILIFSMGMVMSGCITPNEKKEIRKDVFDAQARILHLEQLLNASAKGGSESNKRAANTSASLDRMTRDLQMLRGEIDGLRIGVITGQMPGISEENAERSIASTLSDLSMRMELVEKSQEELLAAIKSSGKKSKNKSSRKSTPKKAVSRSLTAKSIKTSFDKKRFTSVVEDAPKVIRKSSGKDKEQTLYLFAESLYKLGKMRDAALKYNDFIESRPSNKFLPRAKLRMGDCFRHLGDKDTAKLYYDELIREFPDSSQAGKAKEQIAKLAG